MVGTYCICIAYIIQWYILAVLVSLFDLHPRHSGERTSFQHLHRAEVLYGDTV